MLNWREKIVKCWIRKTTTIHCTMHCVISTNTIWYMHYIHWILSNMWYIQYPRCPPVPKQKEHPVELPCTSPTLPGPPWVCTIFKTARWFWWWLWNDFDNHYHLNLDLLQKNRNEDHHFHFIFFCKKVKTHLNRTAEGCGKFEEAEEAASGRNVCAVTIIEKLSLL